MVFMGFWFMTSSCVRLEKYSSAALSVHLVQAYVNAASNGAERINVAFRALRLRSMHLLGQGMHVRVLVVFKGI